MDRFVQVNMDESAILYEDEDLLVVNKPCGLPMHANLDLERQHLVGTLKRLMLQLHGSEGYLGTHQRLDKDTSGVIVFTRRQQANPSVAQQFEQRTVQKEYLALIGGRVNPPPEMYDYQWVVDMPIGEPKHRGGAVTVGEAGGKVACTHFTLLGRSEYGLFVKARLLSGRKHQIRAHLSYQGLPILGDRLYGGFSYLKGQKKIERPMLHAYSLQLNHPQDGRVLSFIADPPEDFLEALKAMRLTYIWRRLQGTTAQAAKNGNS